MSAISANSYGLVADPGAEEARTNLDAPGAVLVTFGLMAAVFGFSQAPIWGWLDYRTLGTFAVTVVLLALFLFNEQHAPHPLMSLSIFKIRNVSGANLIMATLFAGNLGMFFLLTLCFQGVEHYSPIQTGLAFLPFPIILGTVSTQMANLVRKHGFRRYLILGPSLVAIGMAWICLLPVHGSSPLHVLPGLLIMPIGYGMTFAPMYAAATAGVPRHFAGVASGLITTSEQMGGAIGLAILSGVAATLTSSLTHDTTAQALTSGYNLGMAVSVIFTLISVFAAILVIRTPKLVPVPSRAPQPVTVH
jgi:MFS family permease